MGRLLNWLTHARPWEILLVYAAVIVVFAGLFTMSAGYFYQSKIKFEPAERARKMMLGDGVKTALESEFKRDPHLGPGVTFQLVESVQISGEQDSVLSGLAVIDAALQGAENPLFSLKVPFVISPETHKVEVVKPGYVLMPEGPSPPPGFQGKIRLVYFMADPGRPVEDESLLPHRPQEQKLVANTVSKALERVQLDATIVEQAQCVIGAEEGKRCSRWATFGGMLYFSAITITTVGYGDVVPLSNLTRLLAATEATLGIVLLGLFVNSIVRSARAT